MDRYVMKRLCEEARQEMASKSKEDAKFEWTPNAEVLFLYSMIGHKPVGVNRHFMMLLIHKKFSEYMNCEVSSEELWDHLNTMYNMSALNESENVPFPNDEIDFELPEDCYEVLLAKHGISLQRSNSESETNEASSSKSSKKLTSRIKQSGRSVSTPKSNCASALLNKSSKSQTAVKNERKIFAKDATPKVKQVLGLSAKTTKIKHSSGPLTNKMLKSESSVTKEDSPDNALNKRNSKLDQGSSPATWKKPIKTYARLANISSEKPAKNESSSIINESKSVKTETSPGSVKKIKPNKDLVSKKGKVASSEMSAKKQKDDKNSVQKKIGHENTTKKNESSAANHGKAVVRSSSHSSKGQEMETPSSSGDQYKRNETSRWLSVQLIDVLKNPLAEQDVDVFRFKQADEKLSNNVKSKLLDNETCAHVSSTSVGFDADSQNKKTEKQR